MAIDVSIIFMPVWERIKQYLVVDEYNRDGSAVEPRIRIGFDDLPDALGHELVMLEMPCVACLRPNHPLRRRDGDPWSRLFYAPTCALTTRMACSRGRSASLEYERFKSIASARPSSQLAMF